MGTPITSIRNLGPAVEAACRRAGIVSAEELRAMGPDEAYARMIRAGMRPHFIGYYSMVMGLHGRPWNECRGDEKDDLRKRFDAIKSDASGQPASALERALDELGVMEKSLRRPG